MINNESFFFLNLASPLLCNSRTFTYLQFRVVEFRVSILIKITCKLENIQMLESCVNIRLKKY